MKKRLSAILIISLSIALISCTGSNTRGEASFSSVVGDWAVYKDPDELITNSNLILTGKITDISFAMLDNRAQAPTKKSKNKDLTLHTIYSFELIDTYKGDSTNIESIRFMGGLMDAYVGEQFDLIGKYNQKHIPIIEEHFKLEIGQTYLLVLYQFENTIPTLLNPNQSIYNIANPTKKYGISNRDYDETYNDLSEDEFGNPLISANDILSSLGAKLLD